MREEEKVDLMKEIKLKESANRGSIYTIAGRRIGEYLENNEIAIYAAKQVSYGTNTMNGIMATIKLIENIFASKGFSREEAFDFISKNRHIFERTYREHVSVLAILSILHLDEEAIFNRPGFIQEKHNLVRLYDAIKTVRESGEEATLEKVKSIEKDESKEVEYKLTKDKLSIYQKLYLSTLKNKVDSQSKGRVMKQD